MSKTAIHTGSRLYQIVADMQGDRPWGNFLDAGTGKGSLRWLLTLDTERWTAITASPGMAEQVTRELGDQKRPEDRLLVGNWSDPEFLQGERFDTVLADYLLGAIDGFAPYTQDQLFSRLRPLTDQHPEPLDYRSQVWIREHAGAPWLVDGVLTPDDDGRWVSKRDPEANWFGDRDLLTEEEERVDAQTAHLRFDIGLLAERLVAANICRP